MARHSQAWAAAFQSDSNLILWIACLLPQHELQSKQRELLQQESYILLAPRATKIYRAFCVIIWHSFIPAYPVRQCLNLVKCSSFTGFGLMLVVFVLIWSQQF